MSSKTVPFRGEFCRVLTSAYSMRVGYVNERTIDTLTVQFKGDLVGKYKVEANEFVCISPWWGEDGLKMSIDEKIDVLEEMEKNIDFSKGEDNYPEDFVSMEIDDWLATIRYDAPFGEPPHTGRTKSTLDNFEG